MNISAFMKKVRANKRTVENWLEKGMISGADFNEITGEWFIPDSARRPYIAPWNLGTDADSIRISIVNACLKNQYISKETYHLSKGEFSGYIDQLIDAGLITKRIEDEIVYFDSTLDSSKFANMKKTQRRNAIAKIVKEAIKVAPYVITAYEEVNRMVG